MYCVFVFFKQKTAYELRISDWSSDVCSSDLCGITRAGSLVWDGPVEAAGRAQQDPGEQARGRGRDPEHEKADRVAHAPRHRHRREGHVAQHERVDEGEEHHRRHARGKERSEEHTSELQSLMRISYAVLCLKKKH